VPKEEKKKKKEKKDLTLPVASPESRIDFNSILCKERTTGGFAGV